MQDLVTMQRFGKHSAAAQRFAERRERENSAPRLHDQVPDLLSLRLEVEERSGAASVTQSNYIRRIVVASAPALFLIPCGDPDCTEGGHDITVPVMGALQRRQTDLRTSDDCHGSLGSANCSRVVHCQMVAEYEAPERLQHGRTTG